MTDTVKICVVVNGECNHFASTIEDDEIDFVNPHGRDVSQMVQFEVCDNCGAYRAVGFDHDWQGIPVLPVHKGQVLNG